MHKIHLKIINFLEPWFYSYSADSKTLTIYNGLFDFTGIEINIVPDICVHNPDNIQIFARKNYKFGVKIANQLRASYSFLEYQITFIVY